ncbi:hypothetical protein GCM10029978_076660 [Actinoallomurus acanthiterrae]
MNRPRKLLAALTAVVLATGGVSAADAAASAGPMRPAASSPDAAFKGIIAFSGGHTSDLASNPDIAGRSLA